MGMEQYRWKSSESELAISLFNEGVSFTEIGRRLNRSNASVRHHLQWKGVYTPKPIVSVEKKKIAAPATIVERICVPQEAVAERDYRVSLAPRDITAAFFGDPKPGYSALERRS